MYWIPAGIAAISLLISMSWLGWWYSRLMKGQFKECVLAIDGVDKEDWDENEASGYEDNKGSAV